MLLLRDHHLELLSLLVLNVFLTHPLFARRVLVRLGVQRFVLRPEVRRALVRLDALGDFLLDHKVLTGALLLLLHLLTLALELLLLHVHVATTLPDNVVGSLASLVDFANGLVLLLFQEANTVAKKFKVLFSALTGHLSGH